LLLSGSIRRKMGVNLLLGLGMLMTLCVGALSGLASYRRLVRELNYSLFEAPRPADVAEAIGALFEPLVRDFPDTLDGADAQRRAFEESLQSTRSRLVDFHRRLDQLSPSDVPAEQRRQTESVLAALNAELADLEAKTYLLGDMARRQRARRDMLQQIARLQTRAAQIPDHQSGLHESLERAQKVYRSRIRLVIGTSILVLVLFVGFAYCIYAGILKPLRKLHQGALRVADGDFQYQLELPGRGEMAELADAFNKMTTRFQEAQQDLNNQVRERSRQLVRSERLAGIGFLAAGVAHEINNPLSAISMAAESLAGENAPRHQTPTNSNEAENATKTDVTATYLAMIRREAERCQQITKRLLDFARGNDGGRAPVDLTRLVSEVLQMVRPLGKYRDRNIEFFRTEPCVVEANGPEIKQVVLNIVSNALEAMEAGGTLRIRFAVHTDDVQIVFDDEGCGMSDDVLEHLFEPFFTQRRDGRGTGLGMALSERIVRGHGGTLEAESAGEGCGSTFRLQLPRRAAPQNSAA